MCHALYKIVVMIRIKLLLCFLSKVIRGTYKILTSLALYLVKSYVKMPWRVSLGNKE